MLLHTVDETTEECGFEAALAAVYDLRVVPKASLFGVTRVVVGSRRNDRIAED